MTKIWQVRQQNNSLRNVTYSIFKIMGLAPFAIKNTKKANDSKDSRPDHRRVSHQFVSSNLGGLYNLCLIPGQLYLAILSSEVNVDVTFPYKSQLTDIIEVAITICGNGVVSVIWLVYLVEQKTLAALVNRLTQVDVTLAGVKGTSLAISHDNRSGCRNNAILIVTKFLLWIPLLFSEKLAFDAPMFTWFTFIVPSIIIDWFMVQYILAMNLMENRFKLLNDILVRLSMTPIAFPLGSFFNGQVSIDDFQQPKIVTLRRAHTDLYEISCGVADFYSFPILFVIGFVALGIFYNANYLVVIVALGAENLTKWVIVNTVVWLIVQIYPITLLIAGVKRVTNEMKKTAIVIPNLLAQPTTSRRDKIELKNFAFEMLNKNLEFTAFGFFPLDSNLLQSIFGMVGTYVTIMIQFHEENSTSSIRNNNTACNLTRSD